MLLAVRLPIVMSARLTEPHVKPEANGMHSAIGKAPVLSSGAPTCVSNWELSDCSALAAMRTPVDPVSTSMRSTVTHGPLPCVPGAHTWIEAYSMLMLPIELSTRTVTVLFLSVLMLLV